MGISPAQFEQMRQRVSGGHRAGPALTPPPARVGEIILGIDPSLRGTGYGVVRHGRPEPEFITAGTIKCPAAWMRSRCLAHIAGVLREVIDESKPDVCVVEGLFFAQNLQTAIIMGEARGAALAVVAGAGLQIFEIAPRKAKQAIVGYGAAQKDAVARMVRTRLKLALQPEPDAADALALALALTQHGPGLGSGGPKRI